MEIKNKRLLNLTFSPIKGGSGNIEYVSLFGEGDNPKNTSVINEIVELAFLTFGAKDKPNITILKK